MRGSVGLPSGLVVARLQQEQQQQQAAQQAAHRRRTRCCRPAPPCCHAATLCAALQALEKAFDSQQDICKALRDVQFEQPLLNKVRASCVLARRVYRLRAAA